MERTNMKLDGMIRPAAVEGAEAFVVYAPIVLANIDVSPSFTPSPPGGSPTKTATLTRTGTATKTSTTTKTPTATRTATSTRTASATGTASPSSTSTGTATPTRTQTATKTSTCTPTPTSTKTPIPSPTPTQVPYNLALEKEANASSWLSGHEAGLAVDGRVDTYWFPDAGEEPIEGHSIAVDLGGPYRVASIELVTGQVGSSLVTATHKVAFLNARKESVKDIILLGGTLDEQTRTEVFEPWLVDVTRVSVTTAESTETVGWREIRVVGLPASLIRSQGVSWYGVRADAAVGAPEDGVVLSGRFTDDDNIAARGGD